ncbi:hypothetical protein ACQ859_00245 [Roseateles chitinivorans]|uniref:hypothetical protein n=1 Tax=Roseateles chitinivorans TaxID=2917965 RepID=UPI003D679AF5
MSTLFATFSLLSMVVSTIASFGCIWFAAKIVGANEASVGRCAAAGVVSVLVVIAGVMLLGPLRGLLVAPLLMLVAFKFILDTSFLAAFIIGVLTIAFQTGLRKLLA